LPSGQQIRTRFHGFFEVFDASNEIGIHRLTASR
jgi:hypothetical protein